MELVRKRLSAAELIPPNIRYNPDTDQVQFSPDGGVTWFDTPSADPRHSDVFRYPPLETADPRCDAAANMPSRVLMNGVERGTASSPR